MERKTASPVLAVRGPLGIEATPSASHRLAL